MAPIRMRASAELPFEPHVLLEHQGFVRSLARRLARDEHEADELEQDAWLVALEREPRHLREPRVWFARVVHNLSRTRRRAEARRREHEARGARAGEASERAELDELSARLAIAQEVVAATLELSEPYRRVVLLRHFRRLAPERIAAELGVPLETVRTRLRRAHERLRERLDRQHGGRERWLPALLAWARDPRASGEGAAATSAAAGTGGIIMVAGTLTLVAVAIAIGVSMRAEERPAPAGGASPGQILGRAADTEPADTPVAAGQVVGASSASDAAERRAQVAPAPGWWLVGGLKGAEVSEQPAKVRLRDARGRELFATEVPAASFELALDALAPEFAGSIALELAYDHPDLLPGSAWIALPASFALEPGERRELRAPLDPVAPAGFVQGLVDASGTATPGGVVVSLLELDREGEPASRPLERATLSPGERFRLRARRLGPHVLVAELARAPAQTSAELLAPVTRRVAVVAGSSGWETLRLEPGETLSGRAVDAAGRELEGLIVTLQPRTGGRLYLSLERPLFWTEGSFQHARLRAHTGGDGGFAVSGLAADEYTVALNTPLQDELDHEIPTVTSGVAQQSVRAPAVDVLVTRDVRIRMLVVTSGGRPLEDAEVVLMSGGTTMSGSDRVATSGRGGANVVSGEIGQRIPFVAKTDAHGRVRMVTAPDTAPVAMVSKDGYAPGFLTPPVGEEPGDELRLELSPQAQQVALTFALPAWAQSPGLELRVGLEPVVDEDREAERDAGAPGRLSGVNFEFIEFGAGGSIQPVSVQRVGTVAADGRVEVGAFAPGRYAVRIELHGRSRLDPPPLVLPARLELELVDGADQMWTLALEPAAGLELFVPDECRGIELRLFDASEQPVELHLRPMSTREAHRPAGAALAPGPYEADPALAPGEYTLVSSKGGAVQERRMLDLRAREVARVWLDAAGADGAR